jgi:hypothetical protein
MATSPKIFNPLTDKPTSFGTSSNKGVTVSWKINGAQVTQDMYNKYKPSRTTAPIPTTTKPTTLPQASYGATWDNKTGALVSSQINGVNYKPGVVGAILSQQPTEIQQGILNNRPVPTVTNFDGFKITPAGTLKPKPIKTTPYSPVRYENVPETATPEYTPRKPVEVTYGAKYENVPFKLEQSKIFINTPTHTEKFGRNGWGKKIPSRVYDSTMNPTTNPFGYAGTGIDMGNLTPANIALIKAREKARDIPDMRDRLAITRRKQRTNKKSITRKTTAKKSNALGVKGFTVTSVTAHFGANMLKKPKSVGKKVMSKPVKLNLIKRKQTTNKTTRKPVKKVVKRTTRAKKR